jgi:hypothetical protein
VKQHKEEPCFPPLWATLAGVLLCLALVLAPAPALSAAHDPHHTWRTLATDHFRITYHEGEERVAAEMARICDRIWQTVTDDVGNHPRVPIQLVLTDETDSSNGYASRLPVNTIVIFVTGPQEDSSLDLYSDWNQAILTHEFTHIAHLDTVSGVPRVVRMVFGRIIAVNEVSPRWIVEGYPTWEETLRTPGGRGRANEVDMIKRMTVLEGHLPPLGNMDGYQADPPGGNIRYILGEDFIDFIARKHGQDIWKKWTQTYGRWCVPFWLPSRKVFDESYVAMYREWEQDLKTRYEAQKAAIEAQGTTTGRLVSDGEAACVWPSFSPDGSQLAWFCVDRARGPKLMLARADGSEARRIVRDLSAKPFTWRPDGFALLFSSDEAVTPWVDANDLYLRDLASPPVRGPEPRAKSHYKGCRMLTRGARLRDATYTPDGQGILAVQNDAQTNNLVRLASDGSITPLSHYTDSTQISTPRYSPDGRWIAVSSWHDGTRDLWILKADGTPWRRVTHDAAIERTPVFTADGATLLFVSDRSGVSNIYAVDLADERLHQITNVVGGAFTPALSPDEKTLAYADYTWNGEDIRLMPFDRGSWRDAGVIDRKADDGPPLSTLLLGPAALLEAAPQPYVEQPSEPALLPPSSRYNPLPTLLPPRYLMPGISTWSGGFVASLSTSGADILHFLSYDAFASWRSDDHFLGGGGDVQVGRWRTVLSTGAQVSAVEFGKLWLNSEPPSNGGPFLPGAVRSDVTYTERRTQFAASASYPLTPYQSLLARWTGQIRENLRPLPDNVYFSSVPTRGFLSDLSLGWNYGHTWSYAYSISPELGREIAVGARAYSPLLGSFVLDRKGKREPFEQLETTGEWREYIGLPWAHNHVLALREATGFAWGDSLQEGTFRLGGNSPEGGLGPLPSEARTLRGFPEGTAKGDAFWLSVFEYRLPIWRIDRGVGTIPIFVHELHAAVFADTGNAAMHSTTGFDNLFDRALVGTGAELRLSTVVLWTSSFNYRVGYAFALAGKGNDPGSLDGFYFGAGGGF